MGCRQYAVLLTERRAEDHVIVGRRAGRDWLELKPRAMRPRIMGECSVKSTRTPPTQRCVPVESNILKLTSSGCIGKDLFPNNIVTLTSKLHGNVQMGPVFVRFSNWAPGMREYIASAIFLERCYNETECFAPDTSNVLWDLVKRKARIDDARQLR
jgi:hypothetical protein